MIDAAPLHLTESHDEALYRRTVCDLADRCSGLVAIRQLGELTAAPNTTSPSSLSAYRAGNAFDHPPLRIQTCVAPGRDRRHTIILRLTRRNARFEHDVCGALCCTSSTLGDW